MSGTFKKDVRHVEGAITADKDLEVPTFQWCVDHVQENLAAVHAQIGDDIRGKERVNAIKKALVDVIKPAARRAKGSSP